MDFIQMITIIVGILIFLAKMKPEGAAKRL